MCDVLLYWNFWLWVPAGVRMVVYVPLLFPLNTNKCKWKKPSVAVCLFTGITFDLCNIGAFRTCWTLSLYCQQTHYVILLQFPVPPHNFCQPLVWFVISFAVTMDTLDFLHYFAIHWHLFHCPPPFFFMSSVSSESVVSSSTHFGGARAPPGGCNCQGSVGIGSPQASQHLDDHHSWTVCQHVKGGFHIRKGLFLVWCESESDGESWKVLELFFTRTHSAL